MTQASGLSTYADVARALLGQYGSAPTKLQGIMTAVDFYAAHVTTKSPQDAFSELTAIDFSKPVAVRVVPSGTALVTFARLYEDSATRTLKPGLGAFYSLAGQTPYKMGITTDGRRMVRVVSSAAFPALESTASGLRIGWTDDKVKPYADGGALQLRICDWAKPLLQYDRVTGVASRQH